MHRRTILGTAAAFGGALPALAVDMPANQYAGQQARSIKALSDDDIAALRKREGMGMAKVAELNGYPGPVHVLALARQLSLTEDQTRQVQLVFDRMSAAAKPLGDEVITHERTLDQLFAKGDVSPDSIVAETRSIGEPEGLLRSVHLAAHLETRELLTSDQVTNYQRLRGYGDNAVPSHHHPG
jgi:hypothetical protein